ncbi:MAG: helix-turn-helix transcriptional regulator [Planctomycetes bacterium]|nr:helix-turn-helix transcriptional regulator [Planctomycetota bacterium]
MKKYTKLRYLSEHENRAVLREMMSEVQSDAQAGKLSYKVLTQEGTGRQVNNLLVHPFPELFVQIRGVNRFSFPGHQLELRPGQVTVVPPWLPHGEETVLIDGEFLMLVITSYAEGCSIHYSTSDSEAIQPRSSYWEYFYSSHGGHMFNLCREFSATVNYPDEGADNIRRGIGQAIFGYADYLLKHGVKTEEAHLVVVAKHHLGRNIGRETLSVKSMARELKCNPDYLSNLFHKVTGERIMHYIRRLRLDQSRELLANTNLTVAEIARISGFHTSNYFSRTFREEHGITPGQYRKTQPTAKG